MRCSFDVRGTDTHILHVVRAPRGGLRPPHPEGPHPHPWGPPPRGPTPRTDSRRWIFEILVQFYISISNLNFIWNDSIFYRVFFGSLRALDLVFRLWDINFCILWSILYKYTKFQLNLEWLHFYCFRLLESSLLDF